VHILRSLRSALVLALAVPAMSALAADPAPEAREKKPEAATEKLVQAQVQAAAAASPVSEKIEVSAQREHYRGDVSVEDLPQSVQVISGETLKLVGAVKINDALDLATGVARQNTFGGLWDGFAIRGFAGDLNVPSGYLVNGFNGGRGFGGLRDTSSVERIEILKGPGSALFGRSEPGGTVSITTKKPQFKPEGSVTFAAGSYDFLRAEGDFTTPVSESTAVRINGAIEDADSFRDTVHTKRSFASPSILSKLGNNTTIWYELEWSRQEIPFDRGVLARNGELGIIPNSRYLGEPGDGPTVAKVLGHQLELQHNLGKNWVLLVGAAYRTTELNGIGQNPEFAAARNPFFTDGQTLSRQRRFTDYESSDRVGRVELSGGFNTGPVAHHLLAGTDYEEFQLDRLQTRYRPPAFNASSTLAILNAVNIFNPVYGNAPAANQNVFNDTEKQKGYGIYVTDQLDLTQDLKLRLGARYDKFKQHIDNRLSVLQPPEQDVTASSPQAGLMYKVSDSISLYTAGAKGFRPNTGFDVQRQPFAPEKTTSYEVGMKFESADGNVNGTLAVFKMKKTNVITADPVNQGQSIAIGEAESKGIELDVAGKLPGRVQVLFSYAYTDAISSTNVLDPDFGRVVASGDPLLNIPKHNANLLLLKDLDVGGRKLTLGAGVKYVSRRLGETGTNFYLPGYSLTKILATYEVTRNLSVTGEVTNLFDKVYYPASFAALWVYPGAPRQYQVRATYRF
jgi:iron complex outermembrane recepter protein